MSESKELAVPEPRADVVRAEDFMPLLTVEQAVQRKGMINQFIGQVMHEGEDFGLIPGAGTKKVLLKPGAEKLCSIFGLAPTFTPTTVIEDWTGQDHGGEPLFHYEYRCQLSRGGRFAGEGIGSANTWESKYRYRWLNEEQARSMIGDRCESLPKRGGTVTIFEFDFALEKREMTGQYGKPAEYWNEWAAAIHSGAAKRATKATRRGDQPGYERQINTMQYRVPNPDVADVINTVQKMGQKRALIAAVLVVTNCSDAFTQDLEDFEPSSSQTVDAVRSEPAQGPTSTGPAASAPAERQVPEELQIMFEGIRRSGGIELKASYDLIERAFAKRGIDAFKRFEEMNQAFRKKHPKGSQQTIQQHLDHIMDLWDALQTFQEPQTAEAAQ